MTTDLLDRRSPLSTTPWLSRSLVPLVLLAACGSRNAGPVAVGPGVGAGEGQDPVAAGPSPAEPPPASPSAQPTVTDADPVAEAGVVIEPGVCAAHPGAHVASAADSAAILELMRGWLSEPGSRAPAINYRRGVVYVQSEEDRGDDPPYPLSAAAESERACGSHAQWLRSEVRERLRWRAASGMLRCEGVVCCYDGMEYAPTGYVVFQPTTRDGETVWALAAAIEVYEAALGEEVVTANREFVARALAKLEKQRCKGEPAGAR